MGVLEPMSRYCLLVGWEVWSCRCTGVFEGLYVGQSFIVAGAPRQRGLRIAPGRQGHHQWFWAGF